jgi:intein/homing endonuclease
MLNTGTHGGGISSELVYEIISCILEKKSFRNKVPYALITKSINTLLEQSINITITANDIINAYKTAPVIQPYQIIDQSVISKNLTSQRKEELADIVNWLMPCIKQSVSKKDTLTSSVFIIAMGQGQGKTIMSDALHKSIVYITKEILKVHKKNIVKVTLNSEIDAQNLDVTQYAPGSIVIFDGMMKSQAILSVENVNYVIFVDNKSANKIKTLFSHNPVYTIDLEDMNITQTMELISKRFIFEDNIRQKLYISVQKLLEAQVSPKKILSLLDYSSELENQTHQSDGFKFNQTTLDYVASHAGITFGYDFNLSTLETSLKKRVYGQDHVLDLLIETVGIAKYGMSRKNRPLLTAIFGGPTGVGKCIHANSIIWYSGGMKRIRSIVPLRPNSNTEVNINLDVMSWNSNKSVFSVEKATKLWKDEVKTGYELSLEYGYSEKTSPWHPVYGYTKKEGHRYYTSKEIDELVKQDEEIYIPLVTNGHTQWNKQEYAEIVSVYKEKRAKEKFGPEMTFKTLLTEEVAYLLGVLCGDGSLNNHTKDNRWRKSRIGLTNSNLTILKKSIRAYRESFLGGTISHSSKNEYNLGSKKLRSLLDSIGLNTTSIKKEIPDIIFDSPKTVTAAFVRGLFDTDGSASKRGYIEITLGSEELIKDLQVILLGFGILSSYKTSYNKKYKKNYYRLDIQSYARKFYDEIGFSVLKKHERKSILSEKNNPNIKYYPPCVSKEMKESYMNLKSQTQRKSLKLIEKKYGIYMRGKRIPSQAKLESFIIDIGMNNITDNLKKLYSEKSLIWLKVKNVKEAEVDLYDLVVPTTHSFIANGIINHNTETATGLSEHLFGKNTLIRVDMGEYTEHHSVSRLIGSPPGYVGYATDTAFAAALKKSTRRVILFDEIEKAAPNIHELLLGVLDNGRLTLSTGELLDLRESVIIMTTNALADQAGKAKLGFLGVGENKDALSNYRESLLKHKTFAPEFINRMDLILPFKALTTEAGMSIALREINQIKEELSYQGYILEYTQEIIDKAIKNSDTNQGGRGIIRAIDSWKREIVSKIRKNEFIQKDNKKIIVIEGSNVW